MELTEELIKAEQGDPVAQYHLGMSYKYGWLGCNISVDDAVCWFEASSNNGFKQATFELALMYRDKLLVDNDDSKYIHLLQRAKAQGHLPSRLMLNILLPDLGVSQSRKILAALTLGAFFENGLQVRKCSKEATGWYRYGANCGSVNSQYHLGRILHTLRVSESWHWLRLAALSGNRSAQLTLAYFDTDKIKLESVAWMMTLTDEQLLNREEEYEIGFDLDELQSDLEETLNYLTRDQIQLAEMISKQQVTQIFLSTSHDDPNSEYMDQKSIDVAEFESADDGEDCSQGGFEEGEILSHEEWVSSMRAEFEGEDDESMGDHNWSDQLDDYESGDWEEYLGGPQSS